MSPMRLRALLSLSIAGAAAACGGGGHSGPDRVPPSYSVTEPVVFVAVGGSGTLRVLKQADLSSLANVTLRGDARPHHLALSSDHTRLSVSILPAQPADGGTAMATGKGEVLV